MTTSFLIRARQLPEGGYSATVRQLAGHPEDLASVGDIATGVGVTEMAAILAALANQRLGTVHEVRRVS